MNRVRCGDTFAVGEPLIDRDGDFSLRLEGSPLAGLWILTAVKGLVFRSRVVLVELRLSRKSEGLPWG